MARTTQEWIGKTDDTPVPPRVRLRVFLRKEGRCHKCRRKIDPQDKWTCEHLIALINDGENRESNLDLTCSWCLPQKNAEDVKEKARTARKKMFHLGIKRVKPQLRSRGFDKTEPQRKASRPLTKKLPPRRFS